MPKMTPVIRIKAELALTAAHGHLVGQHSQCTPTVSPDLQHASTINAVRKEVAKLVDILADDCNDKHFNVSARLAACAGYLALIANKQVQEATRLMNVAQKLLEDTQTPR